MASERKGGLSKLRRLTVLQDEAALTPLPRRKYFHIGQIEMMPDVGECLPMVSFVDDNLSRFVLSDVPSSSWASDRGLLVSLPNLEVKSGEGVFVVSGAGEDESLPHPAGKGKMHFVHLGLVGRQLGGMKKVFLYRLDGVQVKGLGV